MSKVDRLGWAAGVSFVAYGLRIGIRVNDPEAMGAVLDLLPPGWRPAQSPIVDRIYSLVVGGTSPTAKLRRFNLLYVGSARLVRSMDLARVFEVLETDLQLFVAEMARRRLFVHAGVVGWNGRAIVIPGRSFSGKTTLVGEMLRNGATYYSDEYAVFDSRGRVHPYPGPPSVRVGATDREAGHPTGPAKPGSSLPPLPVALVVVTKYRSDARWAPRGLSPGRAVLALLANTVAARRRPKSAITTLRGVVSDVRVLQGDRGEAKDTALSLLETVDSNTELPGVEKPQLIYQHG